LRLKQPEQISGVTKQLLRRIITIFVRAFSQAFHDPVERNLSLIDKVVPYGSDASEIRAESGQSTYSQHPPEAVSKALRVYGVYAGLLSGREEAAIRFPSFPSLNSARAPEGIGSFRLDLTKEQIEITEETTPVDAEGNIQLDATQTRVRTLSYNGDRERAAARKQAEAEALKQAQIGQTIAGKGVYLGGWKPRDRDGNSLGKAFNVFAAPEDLTDESGKKLVATFKKAAERITALRNWHGHDGGDFANDTALYQGLADGSAIGKWFIPTRDLLVGTDLNGSKVRADNLYANKDKGDLKGTFTTAGYGGNREYPVWYWSCTENLVYQSCIWNCRFSVGDGDCGPIDTTRLSCRPCRVEALIP
jgi:hypothetical protein